LRDNESELASIGGKAMQKKREGFKSYYFKDGGPNFLNSAQVGQGKNGVIKVAKINWEKKKKGGLT